MKYTDQTVAMFNSSKIKQVFFDRCVNGSATSITVNGETVSADDLSKHYKVKIKKSNKYTVEKQDADLGQTQSPGDSDNAGDGISQDQE